MLRRQDDVTILIAEDDDEYYLLLEESMKEAAINNPVHRFSDGEALMDHLNERIKTPPSPSAHCLILMDLNMPRKTGHEALREIRAIPELRRIPVVIMTVSTDPRDVKRCYESGANSYICKPFDYEQLIRTFRILKEYWFEKVQLPLN